MNRPASLVVVRPLFLLAPLALAFAPPAGAFDGAFVPIEGGAWDLEAGPVTYVLEPSGSDDIDDGSDLVALRDAFRAWECVEGTSLRFQEGDGAGPADLNLDDGKNTLFWDETGAFGLGPGTLGVTLGTTSGKRAAADIVFNGADHQWSTDDGPSGTDVGAIAAHEIGHMIGLDHPCDKGPGGQESNCNDGDRSVMAPAWNGELVRGPLGDDAEGVVALYPSGGDGSSCEGPFRKGERCGCSDDCVEGLVCGAGPGSDDFRCTETCASDDSDCGNGFACVLDPPQGDEPAAGVCVKVDGQKPAGSVCASGNECDTGTCALLFDITRSLCQAPCSSSSDCDEGVCYDGFCMGGAAIEECPVPPEGCACSSTTTSSSTAATFAALVALLSAARVRRARRAERRAERGAA